MMVTEQYKIKKTTRLCLDDDVMELPFRNYVDTETWKIERSLLEVLCCRHLSGESMRLCAGRTTRFLPVPDRYFVSGKSWPTREHIEKRGETQGDARALGNSKSA